MAIKGKISEQISLSYLQQRKFKLFSSNLPLIYPIVCRGSFIVKEKRQTQNFQNGNIHDEHNLTTK